MCWQASGKKAKQHMALGAIDFLGMYQMPGACAAGVRDDKSVAVQGSAAHGPGSH